MSDAASAAAPAASADVTPPEAPAEKDRSFVIDELSERLEQFRILRKSDEAATDRLLDELGAHHRVDRDIVLELSATTVLGQPDRFRAAHQLAMRALEVLDRNGARGAKLARVGPFEPIAQFWVQFFTRFIVRNYEADVIDAIRNLYTRRLAWCGPHDPGKPLLVQARIDAVRATPSYKRNAVGLPAFLLGGAVVSTLFGLLRSAVDWALGSQVAVIIATLVLVGVLAFASWAILKGAAVARRRIRLTTEQPLRALWETIGRCGKPPEDQARQFAVIALVVVLVGFLVIPAAITFIIARF
jgi:hypothetical protein